MMMLRFQRWPGLLPALTLLVFPVVAGAQAAPPSDSVRAHGTDAAAALPTMRAVRETGGPIHLDGVLDEAAWKNAPAASDFMQSYPNPGAKPTDSTEVRVVYDNDAIYVGIRMFDREPSKIAAQLARRDATGIYSDWVHVMIGTYHDRRTAYRFSVNPLGVKKDVLEFDDGNEDTNWDAVWDVATKVDSLGWTAEYRIPFSQLRFSSAEPPGGRVWDMQIMRDVARRNERDSWAPWTQQTPGFVSAFGLIRGVDDIPAPERLEIVPYVTGKLTRAPGTSANPFFRSNDTKLSAGVDVKYGLPNGLTLTGTVNPDFGQVEVDPAVVNLSAFETFFPEKRPFFLEGADVFKFGAVQTHNDYGGGTYFYSRRIGRQPQRTVGGSAITYVDAPDQTSILGAAKLAGHVGKWTVGALDAVTGEQTARFQRTDGTEGTAQVEPLSNYFVGRARHGFNDGNTVVGGMLTATDRSLGDSVLSRLLRRSAYLGGVDFEQSWDKRNWILSGFGAGSFVNGSQAAIAATQRSSSRYFQRPDAGYVHLDTTRTSLGGYTGEVALERNGPIFGSVNVKTVSPGFEINDMGFQSRVDYNALSYLTGYQKNEPGKHLRSWDVFGFGNQTWDYGHDLTFNAYAIAEDATFNNLWQLSSRVTYYGDGLDASLTRGGPLGVNPAQTDAWVQVTSDSRWPVVTTLYVDGTRDRIGGDQVVTQLTLDARPTSFIHVSFGPTVTSLFNKEQYLRTQPDPTATSTYGARYVFANLKQTTLSLDTRVDWTFTPNLTLQVYAQPFVSAGKYAAFKQLHAPRTLQFDNYGEGSSTISSANGVYTVDPDGSGPAQPFAIGNPDFDVRSLHGDAVLRWEYRPGSTLYFVWQQERNDYQPYGDFELRRDAGAIFRTVPTNVFLVKLAYWLGR